MIVYNQAQKKEVLANFLVFLILMISGKPTVFQVSLDYPLTILHLSNCFYGIDIYYVKLYNEPNKYANTYVHYIFFSSFALIYLPMNHLFAVQVLLYLEGGTFLPYTCDLVYWQNL